MGLEVDYHYENGPNSTPKLSLHVQTPNRAKRADSNADTTTSPVAFHSSRWEVAPGTARATNATATPPYVTVACGLPPKNVTARRLDLPSRLLNDDSMATIMYSSPVTVLEGPYVGRSLSLECTFSFRKGVVAAREEDAMPKQRRWN